MYLGLGANIGDRRNTFTRALQRLAELVEFDALSAVYESEPVGFTDQPDFWNLVVRGRTRTSAPELLDAIKRIETELGRAPAVRYGPRLIDIDILLMDGDDQDRGQVEVPHPRMMERAFVLRPLLELDPELVHPVTGERLRDRLRTGRFERTRPLFPGSELIKDSTA